MSQYLKSFDELHLPPPLLSWLPDEIMRFKHLSESSTSSSTSWPGERSVEDDIPKLHDVNDEGTFDDVSDKNLTTHPTEQDSIKCEDAVKVRDEQSPAWYDMPCSYFSGHRTREFEASMQRVLEDMAALKVSSVAARTPLANQPQLFCGFCKNNGETFKSYTSHSLRDSEGRLTCMILRKYKCPRCFATGDEAHTLNYCPFNGRGRTKAPLVTQLKNTKRSATSLRCRLNTY